jgi:hypothetical protein
MFGTKLFTGVGYPTPVSIPEDTTCLIVQVPASDEWWSLITGLFYELSLEWNWQQYEGGLDRDVAAARWALMFDDAMELAAESNQCSALVPAPYWDDDDGADADDEQPANDQDWYGVLVGESTWQEQIEDWFIAAFVAMAATPAAAIAFLTIAPKFRLAWKTANWGAIVKIFLDQTEIATVDTYAETPGIVTYDVFVPTGMGMANGAHELWIMHSGTHNAAATPDANGDFTIQCIRKRLSVEELGVATELRQSSEDACILEYSIDGGETWLTGFDYSLCASPNQPVPTQIIVNPAAPTQTFVSQEGDTDSQMQARADGLCYASEKIVVTMLRAALDICNDEVDAFNLGAIVLTIVTIVLVAVAIISAGSLVALSMVLVSALLELSAQVHSIACTAYEDEDNKDALTCMMFQNLMNQPVTLAGFQRAFDYEAGCEATEVEEIADLFSSMLQSPAYAQRLFDGFLNVLGEAQSAALQGATIASCICAAATWEYLFNFQERGQLNWYPTVDHQRPEDDPSVFVEGCGFQNITNSYYYYDCSASLALGASCTFDFFIPDGCEITYIRFEVESQYPGAGTVLWVDGSCYSLGNAAPIFDFTSSPIVEGKHTITAFVWSAAAASSHRNMKGVFMSGNGNNPFGACDIPHETIPDCV